MHVLIVKLSAIGDVVHAIPAMAALRREMPETRISWVVERSAAPILRYTRGIDRLIEIDTRSWRKNLLRRSAHNELIGRLGVLRSEQIDVAIDMQGLLKSGLVARASGAPRRIGFQTEVLREPASRIFLSDQAPIDEFGPHIIEKNLSLVRHLGIEAKGSYEFPIDIPDDALERLRERLPDAPYAILNPGGGWATKLWPAERFGELAERIFEQHGLESLVTYGPGEERLAVAVADASPHKRAIPFACNLIEFIEVARRAQLFVGGDTGPMHIAAAVNTPIVGLFGPTDPLRNGPFDPRDRAVGRADLDCRTECYRRSCDHWECMFIPVDTVQRAVDARLQKP